MSDTAMYTVSSITAVRNNAFNNLQDLHIALSKDKLDFGRFLPAVVLTSRAVV